MSCPDGICSASDPSSNRSWDFSAIAVTIFLGFVLVIFGTRMKTSLDFSTTEGDKLRRPPVLPYSIPYVGHVIAILWSPDRAVEKAKRTAPSSVFALKIFSERRNVIGSPALITKLYDERESFTKELLLINQRILENVFAMPSKETLGYLSLLKQPLFSGQSEQHLIITNMIKNLERTLPDLLSFNPNPIDQEPWERSSSPQLSDDNNVSTTDLLSLLHIFLTHLAINSILTPSLLGQNPEVAPLLLEMSRCFLPLFTGIPRTIPHPSLPKAHIARLRLLTNLSPFCNALRSATAGVDPGPEWRDLLEDPDAVSPVLETMQQRWAEKELSLETRTSGMAMLLWQINGSHGVTFWMLLHILSTAGLADRVREETKNFVRATQPEKFMGFAQPVSLKLDIEGLMTRCPALLSCYLESVRLYAREWWAGKLAVDYLVTEGEGLTWRLKAGEWVDIPFWLANSDEGLFHPDPEAWRWERHVDHVKAVVSGNVGVESQVFETGGVFGIGEVKNCLQSLCMAFVAGFLVLWEAEPVDGKQDWTLPKPTFAPAVALPNGEFRVRVSKQEVPVENKHVEEQEER